LPLVTHYDFIIAAPNEFISVHRFSLLHVSPALRVHYVRRHTQRNYAVYLSSMLAGLSCDFVAKKSSRLICGVSDKSLIFGEFKLETLFQKVSYALFDLLGFGLWTFEAEKKVIRVSDIR